MTCSKCGNDGIIIDGICRNCDYASHRDKMTSRALATQRTINMDDVWLINTRSGNGRYVFSSRDIALRSVHLTYGSVRDKVITHTYTDGCDKFLIVVKLFNRVDTFVVYRSQFCNEPKSI